jgi:hypothetical protein
MLNDSRKMFFSIEEDGLMSSNVRPSQMAQSRR